MSELAAPSLKPDERQIRIVTVHGGRCDDVWPAQFVKTDLAALVSQSEHLLLTLDVIKPDGTVEFAWPVPDPNVSKEGPTDDR